MSTQAWTFLFVGATFALYLGIAWLTRVKDTEGFFVAGRGVPAMANGMATASDWMSAASFISMAGLISIMGFAGGVYLMGWTGGYVLLALLLAPYLRKFGHFTVPDFVGDRFDSDIARVVAVICAIFISFTYVAGQMRGVGVVFSRFLEVDITVGVVVGMAIVFIYATLGGMKGITWTQVAQYWVLITAFLTAAIAIAIKLTGVAIPQIAMGAELKPEFAGGDLVFFLDKLNTIQTDLGFHRYTDAFVGSWDKANVFFVTLALMAGTAGLPHVIVRFYTVPSVKAARWSAFWALLFISMLYLTAPATAAFARYFMIESLNGQTEETLPEWYQNWEQTGLILWFDDGDGRVRYAAGEDNEIFRNGKLGPAELADLRISHQRWIDTGGVSGADARIELRSRGLSGPDRDIIVLATPEMAELASWIIALIAAGGLAAALSTASGLLLVISSGVAHDIYYRLLRPDADEKQRLLVARTTIGLAVIVAGLFGIYPPGFVSQVVAFAFGLAASTFFPVIVLGIFSKRVGTVPAISGMLAGLFFTGFYIIASVYGGMAPWTFGVFERGISPQGIGAIGMLLNFAVTLGLTPLCAPPSQASCDMVDTVREPEGAGPAIRIEASN
ncbi:MAG: cation acetate symporter [Gammaproteobacteria bacterium]|nr:cation acetate symporter [Gammaproteobacteria bacterium]